MINSRRVQKRYMPLLPTNEDKDVLLFSNDFHPPLVTRCRTHYRSNH